MPSTDLTLGRASLLGLLPKRSSASAKDWRALVDRTSAGLTSASGDSLSSEAGARLADGTAVAGLYLSRGQAALTGLLSSVLAPLPEDARSSAVVPVGPAFRPASVELDQIAGECTVGAFPVPLSALAERVIDAQRKMRFYPPAPERAIDARFMVWLMSEHEEQAGFNKVEVAALDQLYAHYFKPFDPPPSSSALAWGEILAVPGVRVEVERATDYAPPDPEHPEARNLSVRNERLRIHGPQGARVLIKPFDAPGARHPAKEQVVSIGARGFVIVEADPAGRGRFPSQVGVVVVHDPDGRGPKAPEVIARARMMLPEPLALRWEDRLQPPDRALQRLRQAIVASQAIELTRGRALSADERFDFAVRTFGQRPDGSPSSVVYLVRTAADAHRLEIAAGGADLRVEVGKLYDHDIQRRQGYGPMISVNAKYERGWLNAKLEWRAEGPSSRCGAWPTFTVSWPVSAGGCAAAPAPSCCEPLVIVETRVPVKTVIKDCCGKVIEIRESFTYVRQ